MPRVLILSSYVAASRVGGALQALALARLGIEPVLVPTVVFGRHPGWGAPGGSATAPETFESMLDAVGAQGAACDAVIAGYFASAEQVAVAAKAIEKAEGATIVVDPIMGDEESGLYVKAPVAEAIATRLVPRADLMTPNAWELERLSGLAVTGEATAVAAAERLGRPALVSSVRAGAEIGVVYAAGGRGWLASHARSASAPKGTGDLLTALFVAAQLQEFAIHDALQVAVGAVAEAVAAADDAPDLPIAALPTRLAASARVRLEAVHG